eukprot:12313729-Karenia_brevis.AAC.1
MSCIGDLDSIDGDTPIQIDPAAQKLKLQKDIQRYQQVISSLDKSEDGHQIKIFTDLIEDKKKAITALRPLAS